ncbi:CD-NTase-associated protein 6 [Vibrio crassostreae]|uniref:AAA ATPase, central region n=1 Tax=Vibrio tasmaniensis TaxID=212663 RepID=A0A0H4A2N0_9VIBR|nr:ATP-binding protein [Vibrio splendidus]AKN40494.1 AAA ATPase, central region [Vibrio tasmaniensis]CAK2105613.1 CD-NTase-associated protein 6 [Vibrio crassostreae]MCC4791073.1 ATP-binding protein [Vibrio splendidus]MDP2592849.1 ATP-binding protein [Vibrio splendidus]PMM03815.1 ATPase [Vibrio splendidus]
MTTTEASSLFENNREFPDFEAQMKLDRLIGLDSYKIRLTKMLSVLINPRSMEKWVNQFHGDHYEVLEPILNRPPLIVLAGDVGSGKTALAESIGDKVARLNEIDITLLPLSLSSRGQGRVGEMTQLVSSAFQQTKELAKKYKSDTGKSRGAVVLLIDEADAIAQSRESSQMHHEDRAGVNAFIRGIDTLASEGLPAAVIMCTNRLDALDPAVKRRAAEILLFKRPTVEQRKAALEQTLAPFELGNTTIAKIAEATGESDTRDYGFSFSDITQRLVPAIILDAYPNKAVTKERAVEVALSIQPTPPFGTTNE